MTGCECKQPGWCERHQCFKNEHWHHLCQTHEKYFQKWEEGRGLGQVDPHGHFSEAGPCRPGCQLHRLLAKFWIKSNGCSNCGQHAAVMDQWGPAMCRKRLDTIVQWMADEAKKRHLPFMKVIAKRLVLQAIRNAEQEIAAKSGCACRKGVSS